MTYYLKYKFTNVEPVRIADDSIAQKGQTGTLHYIPGSAIRGYVLTMISKQGFGDDYSDYFTRVRFLNAYPSISEENLFPSPKGFYEDKAESEGRKELENVLIDGKDIEGLKRARLGEFCCVKDGTIQYYSVRSKGELKKQMYGNELYRIEYIDRGYVFSGAIASDRLELLERIKPFFDHEIYVGNGRSAGMGLCNVLEVKLDPDDHSIPFQNMAVNEDITSECYMMLLSPTAMRDGYGNPTGLNLQSLQEMMGVSDLKIDFCSTSVRNVQGYNRTWHGAVPSLMMYEKGCVFHLSFHGTLTAEKSKLIMDHGIGERLYDGYGRVVILNDFTEWRYKERGERLNKASVYSTTKEESDEAVLHLIARKYYRKMIEDAMDRYIVSHPLDKGMLKSSKTRGIEPILIMNRFDYDKAFDLLDKYFDHELKKEAAMKIHKELRSTGSIKEHVFTVLDGDLEKILHVKTKVENSVMTIPKNRILNHEEMGELKLLFLLKELRFDSRR